MPVTTRRARTPSPARKFLDKLNIKKKDFDIDNLPLNDDEYKKLQFVKIMVFATLFGITVITSFILGILFCYIFSNTLSSIINKNYDYFYGFISSLFILGMIYGIVKIKKNI